MSRILTALGRAAILIVSFCLGSTAVTAGQYNPQETFAPLTLPQPVNRYRAADGSPGPDYWQNRADYEIHAVLDTDKNELRATQIITYTNNSPQALDSLWLQLDQNIYRRDSRATRANTWHRTAFTDGYVIEAVKTERGGHSRAATTVIDDTRMQVRLRQPLAAGASIRLIMRYHYEVPGSYGGRTAWVNTPDGKIYNIAQWFPRMAVYDDLRGWDTAPYIGAEFYLEYGTIDYFVTVPWDMLVAGSGELRNPGDVLTRRQRQRLQRARHSDKPVFIRPQDEIGRADSRPVNAGTLTWHYRMADTRDVAFAASSAFIWDAARLQLADNPGAMAMSFYPAASAGEDAWGRSTEYLKHAVETFSTRWSTYPYPAAVNVAGKVSGMEYPGLLFDGMDLKGKDLFWLTAHEIGHTWFPMVVGSNERRHAWMDEGLNTFIDVYESDDFQNGVYGPKRDSEYAPGGGNPVAEIQALLADPAAPAIMNSADAISEQYRHSVSYFKTALGLVLLREQILGPQRFDWAFRHYIRDWSFRHPSPSDFFRSMNSAAGEDLDWFWRGWFLRNWQWDVAVESVDDISSDDGGGRRIVIANLEKLVMPVLLEISFQNGTRQRRQIPVETWMQRSRATIQLDGSSPVLSVIIDPDEVMPDGDRSNNVWHAGSGN